MGTSLKVSSTDGKTVNNTYTFNKTISTSDQTDYVGSDGDLYIGNSKNIFYGKTHSPEFQQQQRDRMLGRKDTLKDLERKRITWEKYNPSRFNPKFGNLNPKSKKIFILMETNSSSPPLKNSIKDFTIQFLTEVHLQERTHKTDLIFVLSLMNLYLPHLFFLLIPFKILYL
jgi:hypothetical protein